MGRGGEERSFKATTQSFANLPKAMHTHLFGDNGGKINLMVSIVLEGLSHHRGNKDGGHGQQAVCPECLNCQQLV